MSLPKSAKVTIISSTSLSLSSILSIYLHFLLVGIWEIIFKQTLQDKKKVSKFSLMLSQLLMSRFFLGFSHIGIRIIGKIRLYNGVTTEFFSFVNRTAYSPVIEIEA